MKAIKITAPFKMGVTETANPEWGDGEVLLKINYVGFCGSDLNTYRGGNTMVKYPRIPGHEVSATIVDTGKNVPADLKKGMTVTVNPYTNCGHCAACRNRRYNACENNKTLGVQRDGAMCEYFALPWQKVIPVEGIKQDVIALIEPMSVGFHAVSRGKVTDVDTVMIIGCGMVGLGAVIRSVRRGATVIACDVDDKKLAIAKSIGAKYTVNSITDPVHERLADITHGLMPNVIIEAVGSPITYNLAINEVGFTGRVVCIGYNKNDVSFHTQNFVKKELDICGSRNALPEDFAGVIGCLQQDFCPLGPFISAVCRPEDAAKTMEQWHQNPGKIFRILVKWS
jgi:threonine dehydrogenase-like Zn-dependent dehydrogenase